MRRSLPSSGRAGALAATIAMLAALGAGCGGPPALRIASLNREEQAKVYFKPSHDGLGNELPPRTTPETFLGEMPTEWEVPENLLGARGLVRVEYADGARQEARITIDPKKDTVKHVAKPPVPKK